MNNSANNPNNFFDRLSERIVNDVRSLTDKYFSLHDQLQTWSERKQELEYDNRDFRSVHTRQKNMWFFILFILLPFLCIIDLASIGSFIQYLAAASGNIIFKLIITTVGFAIFIVLELAVGALLIMAKEKPTIRGVAKVLAVVVVIIPPFLVLTGYLINPHKTVILLIKTIALMTFSAVTHILVFLFVTEVWNAIHYAVYRVKTKNADRNDPCRGMDTIREKFYNLYPDLDKYIIQNGNTEAISRLPNKCWYLKTKFATEITSPYDLTDYDPSINYNNNSKTDKL